MYQQIVLVVQPKNERIKNRVRWEPMKPGCSASGMAEGISSRLYLSTKPGTGNFDGSMCGRGSQEKTELQEVKQFLILHP